MSREQDDALNQLRIIFTDAPAHSFIAYKRIENDGRQGAAVAHPTVEALIDMARVLVDASANSPESNFYIRVTPISDPPADPTSQGKDEDAVGSGVVWCDVDTLRAGVDKMVAYEAIMSCIPGYPPALVVDTGGGLHGYWRLREWTTDLARVRGANAAIADRLRAVGGDPAVKNVGRVLRLAGTYNRKPGRENAVARVLHIDNLARIPLTDCPVLPVDAEHESIAVMRDVPELPDDYLAHLRSLGRRGRMVADRIESDQTALRAGASTDENGNIDRSANDHYVACELWRIGRDALRSDDEITAEIMAVFQNDAWLAGRKGRDRTDDYWERTIRSAYGATAQAPDTMYTEKGKVRTEEMASWLADEGGLAFVGVRENAVPYIYSYQSGIYEEDQTGWLLDHIRISLEAQRGSKLPERKEIYEILRHRQDIPHRTLPLDDPGPLIVVRNGVLNVETGELRPHSPSHIGFRRLPTDYRPARDIPAYAFEKVDEFVSRVIPERDDRRVFWQYVGYILHRGYFTRGLFYLIGPHGAGKSALLELLVNCFGPENFSHVTPQQMNSDFGLAPLVNALANVSAEAGVNHSNATIEVMKALSGGDAVSVNRKNRDRIEAKLHVPLLFSANDFPRFAQEGATEALRSRLIVVSSGPTLPQEAVVPDYGILLAHDPFARSAFLSRALTGLSDLMACRGFLRTTAMESVTRRIVSESDDVRQFMADLDWVRVSGDPAHAVEKADLYQHYRRWMALFNPAYRESSAVVFANRLRSLIIEGAIPGLEDRDERQNGRGRNLWIGVQIEAHEDVRGALPVSFSIKQN
jgi:P4 family phage/plasmid primase-like protien